MKKKTPRQKLVKKLDDITRTYIRNKFNHKCVGSGKGPCGKVVAGANSHRSHIYCRNTWPFLRWDEDNLVLHCYPCHKAWHNAPLLAREWFEKEFPDQFARLEQKRIAGGKISVPEMEELLKEYEEKVAKQGR